MARIRTIKPDFFRHEGLQDLQAEHPGLNPMLVFAGLWTVADKAGRFEWKPRSLKLDILPFLDFDLNASLLLLERFSYVRRYIHDGKTYGLITEFAKHQRINGKEAQEPAKHPEPITFIELDQGSNGEATGKQLRSQEGKGREREEEGNGVSREPLAALVPIKPPDKPKTELQVVQAEPSEESVHQAKCRRTWAAYEVAYLKRYGTAPVRNAKVNSLVKQFVIRLGEEAEPVIAYYVNHAARWYVQIAHSLEGAVKDAEKLRMEWATNRKITTATATSSDRMQAASDALCDYLGALEVAQ